MRYKGDFSSRNPNINVHITWSVRDDGTVAMRGYPIDKETGVRLDGIKETRRIAATAELFDITKDHIIHAVSSQVSNREGTRHSTIKKAGEENHLVVERINAIKANPEVVIRPGDWSKDRERNVLSAIVNHVLPFLKEYGPDPLPGDVQEFRARLISKAQNDPRHKHHLNTTEHGIDSRMRAIDIAYRFLFDTYPELGLPDISFAPLGRKPDIHLEQVKSLPREVRRKLVQTINRLCQSDPRLAYVATLMLDGGLRTGEACGTIPANIHFEEEYTTVFVGWQVLSGSVTPSLKTEAAYRHVVMSYWGKVMIQRCLHQFQADGIIVDRDHPAMVPDKASSKVRQLLLDSGLSQEMIETARMLQRLEPDVGISGETVTIEAYILRRDRASRWVNRCGLDADAVDYMLGHKRQIPMDTQKDYRLPEEQALIAQCLERDIYDPEISRNPANCPIELWPDQDYHIIPNAINGFQVLSDRPVQIEITFRANSLGDIVLLKTPEGSLKEPIHYKDSTDTKPAKAALPKLKGGDYNDNSR